MLKFNVLTKLALAQILSKEWTERDPNPCRNGLSNRPVRFLPNLSLLSLTHISSFSVCVIVEEKEPTMSETHVMKCPKCGGQMKAGSIPGDFRIRKYGDMYGDRANVFYCVNCGFIELYKEPSVKESWRMRVRPAEPEAQQPEKEELGRKPDKRLVR